MSFLVASDNIGYTHIAFPVPTRPILRLDGNICKQVVVTGWVMWAIG